MNTLWLTQARLILARGIVEAAVRIAQGRIAAIRARVPRGAERIDLRGANLAPGFMDLHVWGDPRVVAREAIKGGTTVFLTTLGPAAPELLAVEIASRIDALSRIPQGSGATCLGLHLEGPFLNPARAGALPRRWMRPPTVRELNSLARVAGSPLGARSPSGEATGLSALASRRSRGKPREAEGSHLKLMTLAPELSGARDAIRWAHRHRIVASLGHSEADAKTTEQAIEVGARAVTHVFNGMKPFHHRKPGLIDVALTEPRLTTMVIADGVHVSPSAFRLLVRSKGRDKIALVTDSIRYQGWDVKKRAGAYYTRRGILAGSCLTMIEAVRNAVRFGDVSIEDAVAMATTVPARLLGLRDRGRLSVGQRADLVVFDDHFRVHLTIVGGHIVYKRSA